MFILASIISETPKQNCSTGEVTPGDPQHPATGTRLHFPMYVAYQCLLISIFTHQESVKLMYVPTDPPLSLLFHCQSWDLFSWVWLIRNKKLKLCCKLTITKASSNHCGCSPSKIKESLPSRGEARQNSDLWWEQLSI